MKAILIKPCPKCGKMPKVKITYYSTSVSCQIQCKPFLRKPHVTVENSAALYENAVSYAADRWNERADCANLPVW